MSRSKVTSSGVALLVWPIAVALWTWLTMLFLGNLGINLEFWGCLPAGFLIHALKIVEVADS